MVSPRRPVTSRATGFDHVSSTKQGFPSVAQASNPTREQMVTP